MNNYILYPLIIFLVSFWLWWQRHIKKVKERKQYCRWQKDLILKTIKERQKEGLTTNIWRLTQIYSPTRRIIPSCIDDMLKDKEIKAELKDIWGFNNNFTVKEPKL